MLLEEVGMLGGSIGVAGGHEGVAGGSSLDTHPLLASRCGGHGWLMLFVAL